MDCAKSREILADIDARQDEVILRLDELDSRIEGALREFLPQTESPRPAE